MTATDALFWLRELLQTAVVAGSPIVLAISAIAVSMAVLQAATQVNDAAIGFVPKLLGAVGVLAVGGPFVLERLVTFTRAALLAIGALHS